MALRLQHGVCGVRFDTKTNVAMALSSGEAVKEKVQAVREVVPSHSNNEIILVLQYYDNNIEQAIQAFLENGAKQALDDWHYSGNKPNTRKKKRTRNKVTATTATTATTVATADVTTDVTTDSTADDTSHRSDDPQRSQSPTNPPEAAVGHLNGVVNGHAPLSNGAAASTPPLSPGLGAGGGIALAEPVCLSNGDHPTDWSAVTGDGQPDGRTDGCADRPTDGRTDRYKPYDAPVDRVTIPQRTHSGQAGESSTETGHQMAPPMLPYQIAKQPSPFASNPPAAPSTGTGKRPHAGLEKSLKDLHRQTVSLQRLKHVLDDELEKSSKKITQFFSEIRRRLNDREASIVYDLYKVKKEASETFAMRQKRACDLKSQTLLAAAMSDSELATLRTDIKCFVSDRKIDEELGSTTRFVCDMDHFVQEISDLGNVMPVNALYRRTSSEAVAVPVLRAAPLSGVVSCPPAVLPAALPAAPAVDPVDVIPPPQPAPASPVDVRSPSPPPSPPVPNHSLAVKVVSQSESVTKYEVSELTNRLNTMRVQDQATPGIRSRFGVFNGGGRGGYNRSPGAAPVALSGDQRKKVSRSTRRRNQRIRESEHQQAADGPPTNVPAQTYGRRTSPPRRGRGRGSGAGERAVRVGHQVAAVNDGGASPAAAAAVAPAYDDARRNSAGANGAGDVSDADHDHKVALPQREPREQRKRGRGFGGVEGGAEGGVQAALAPGIGGAAVQVNGM